MEWLRRFSFIGLAAFICASFSVRAQSDEKYYNEAFETESKIDGEINILTAYGKRPSFVYSADTYGTIDVYDVATGQVVMYGQVYEDGRKVMVQAGKPRPAKPTKPVIKPRVQGGGWAVAACYAGEAVSMARCEMICRNSGVAEFSGGYCGFASTCKCQAPPPPPPSPTPAPSAGWGFTPPWQTIVHWNGGEGEPISPVDDRSTR